jgi:hypothetical protein
MAPLSDSYPQGKDLYDAVLLHRREPLTAARWRRVTERVVKDEWRRQAPRPTDLDIADTEWAWFKQEYPQLAADEALAALQDELLTAIRSVLED